VSATGEFIDLMVPIGEANVGFLRFEAGFGA
jgi:hypothetical protein